MRIPLLPRPALTALLALPVLALLASPARAEVPGAAPEAYAPFSAISMPAEQAFEIARSGLERDLSETASSLESLLLTDDVKAAEKLYDLERRAIATLVYAANHSIKTEGHTIDETVGGVRSMLQRILRYQERVKEHAQDKLDRVLPGEPARRLVSINGRDGYKPLFRQGTPVPGQPAATDTDRLAEMEKDFVAKGGDLGRDIRLFGKRYLAQLKSGELAEWTQVGKNDISITSMGAKHPVILSQGKKKIGAGKDARRLVAGGGGSAKIWRDDLGEIVLVIASNSSGNLKPGVASVEPLVNKFIDSGVKEERILTTSIVPEEPELVKLLLKARQTMSKAQIDQHVAALKQRTTPALLTMPRRAPVTASELGKVATRVPRGVVNIHDARRR